MAKCILILSVVIYCVLAVPSARYRSTNGKNLSKSDYDYDFNENYDQRQTGDVNIRFGLSNLVFALPGDLLTATSNEESLDDYDDNNNSAATTLGNIKDNEASQIMLLSVADYLSKNNNNLKQETNSGSTINEPINDLKDKFQNDQNKDQQARFIPALRKFVRRWLRAISHQFVTSF